MSIRLILLGFLGAVALAGCDAATQYDSGAVVLDVSEPEAFNTAPQTTATFVSAYEAMKAEDYTRAEALLDEALAQKPRDPYALLAMGSVHERTGRFYSASDYYRSAVRYGNTPASARLSDGAEVAVAAELTVADVARENLLRLRK